MSVKFQFSPEEDEVLMESIRKYPILYDSSNPIYYNAQVKENLWTIVSENVKRTITDCKRRWRNIKSTYVRINRNNKYGTGSAGKPKSKWPLLEHISFLDSVPIEKSTQNNIEDLGDPLKMNTDASTIQITDICTMPNTDTSAISMTSNSDTENSILDIPPDPLDIPLSEKRKPDALHSTAKRQKHDTDKILEIEERATERDKFVENTHKSVVEDSDPTLIFFKSMAMTVKTFPPEVIAEAKFKVLNVINELELRLICQSRRINTYTYATSSLHDNLTGL